MIILQSLKTHTTANEGMCGEPNVRPKLQNMRIDVIRLRRCLLTKD